MTAPTVRFDVTVETIGEQGSPIHWIVQTVTMLRSGIFVSLIKDCFYKLKIRQTLKISLPFAVLL